jgi:hypothetical protein
LRTVNAQLAEEIDRSRTASEATTAILRDDLARALAAAKAEAKKAAHAAERLRTQVRERARGGRLGVAR